MTIDEMIAEWRDPEEPHNALLEATLINALLAERALTKPVVDAAMRCHELRREARDDDQAVNEYVDACNEEDTACAALAKERGT